MLYIGRLLCSSRVRFSGRQLVMSRESMVDRYSFLILILNMPNFNICASLTRKHSRGTIMHEHHTSGASLSSHGACQSSRYSGIGPAWVGSVQLLTSWRNDQHGAQLTLQRRHAGEFHHPWSLRNLALSVGLRSCLPHGVSKWEIMTASSVSKRGSTILTHSFALSTSCHPKYFTLGARCLYYLSFHAATTPSKIAGSECPLPRTKISIRLPRLDARRLPNTCPVSIALSEYGWEMHWQWKGKIFASSWAMLEAPFS